MVRHQAIGMYRASELGSEYLQEAQVNAMVRRRKEARLAVDPALHYVQRQTGDYAARRARHETQTNGQTRTLTF
jgi:hypothetical protein